MSPLPYAARPNALSFGQFLVSLFGLALPGGEEEALSAGAADAATNAESDGASAAAAKVPKEWGPGSPARSGGGRRWSDPGRSPEPTTFGPTQVIRRALILCNELSM
jgi:hypothetical protein